VPANSKWRKDARERFFFTCGAVLFGQDDDITVLTLKRVGTGNQTPLLAITTVTERQFRQTCSFQRSCGRARAGSACILSHRIVSYLTYSPAPDA
jgi:hypothetical protein